MWKKTSTIKFHLAGCDYEGGGVERPPHPQNGRTGCQGVSPSGWAGNPSQPPPARFGVKFLFLADSNKQVGLSAGGNNGHTAGLEQARTLAETVKTQQHRNKEWYTARDSLAEYYDWNSSFAEIKTVYKLDILRSDMFEDIMQQGRTGLCGR